jgi:hypothetical protein
VHSSLITMISSRERGMTYNTNERDGNCVQHIKPKILKSAGQLGDLSMRIMNDNIKIGCENSDCIHLVHDRVQL